MKQSRHVAGRVRRQRDHRLWRRGDQADPDLPVFGLHTTLVQNLRMGAVFTVVSIAQSYVLRRLFQRFR